MDRFELQDQVIDAGRELQRLKAREARGQALTVAGVSVLFTSMGLAAAQSIAAGSTGISAGIAVPLGVTGALGMALFSIGLSQRSSASFEQDQAGEEVRHLRTLYNRRFGQDDQFAALGGDRT